MGSYRERILMVDLTARTFSEMTLSQDLLHEYVGGRGWGIKLLYDDLKPGIDPLGPDNELIFLAGPLCGTNAQSFARWKVFFKSPLTGGAFRSSGGGHFGAELKFAGYDGIIVTGQADSPVYLWIHDGGCEFRDATGVWGLDCDDTHSHIREELRDHSVRLACIGPAGENLVPYAGIFTDRRAAGRGGGGAVMGAKNLKAIAIRGHDRVIAAEPEKFAELVKEQVKGYTSNPMFKSFGETGSTMMVGAINSLGLFPVRNFRQGILTNWESIDAPSYGALRVRDKGCYSCALHCGTICKVRHGRLKGWWSEGPEYETAAFFTGAADCTDIGMTIAADNLCDRLGLDTMSAGNTIGFAYELFERGFLTREDLGGFDLVYGQNDHVLELLRKIAYREGIGDLLAEGTREMSRRIGHGSEAYACQVKGLELAAYDPRGAKSHGLNYATTSIGGDHNSGYGTQELFGGLDRFTVEGKGQITRHNQDETAIRDLGIMCSFAALFTDLGMYQRLLAAATGNRDCLEEEYLWAVGERVTTLERMFNVREGFRRKDDMLPRRFTEESMTDGPCAGQVFEADVLLDDYYRVRGWDNETGIPTPRKLEELGLGFTVGSENRGQSPNPAFAATISS